jgi:hypothetical protein
VNEARRKFCNTEQYVECNYNRWAFRLVEISGFLVEKPWKVANWKTDRNRRILLK